jgi:hypothetical protein
VLHAILASLFLLKFESRIFHIEIFSEKLYDNYIHSLTSTKSQD